MAADGQRLPGGGPVAAARPARCGSGAPSPRDAQSDIALPLGAMVRGGRPERDRRRGRPGRRDRIRGWRDARVALRRRPRRPHLARARRGRREQPLQRRRLRGGYTDRALAALDGCDADNAAPRQLADAGFEWRDLGRHIGRVSTSTPRWTSPSSGSPPGCRDAALDEAVRRFLEMARLPGGWALEVPRLEALGEVIRDRSAELVVAGRMPAATLARARDGDGLPGPGAGRGARNALGANRRPAPALDPRGTHGLLVADRARGRARAASAMRWSSTRVPMASVAGSSDATAWPSEEDRFASDYGDHARVETPWLRADRRGRRSAGAVPVRRPRARERRPATDRSGARLGR